MMDDRLDREAALHSLSMHREEIAGICENTVEVLDAFEQLEIITRDEKDHANESEDYSTVLRKLSERMNSNPSFFVEFCSHLQDLGASEGEPSITSLAKNLVGEPT